MRSILLPGSQYRDYMENIRGAWRQAKNFAYGYSEVQAKLREATSIENRGPSTGQLQEIAQATQHSSYLIDIIQIIDKRLNDHGKYWRHVYKTLVVIEFCAVFGSEAMVMYAKDIIHRIKTLKEFIHIDDMGRDKGILVREKSKDLVELLSNDALLAEARRTGVIPNLSRPKSAEPILVDPKQRKRIGAGNFDDMQNIDEVEALRIALDESRRESGHEPLKYKSLEFDADSDSSEEEQVQNPFATFNYQMLDANPFMMQQQMLPEPPYINPFMITDNVPQLQIEPVPVAFAQIESTPVLLPQLEYNVNSMDRYLEEQNRSQKETFVPVPNHFPSVAENHIAAKPVGPQMSAPQFTYRSNSISKIHSVSEENPFGEDEILQSEAQNSPHVNLQK